jgi:hypothetical protein
MNQLPVDNPNLIVPDRDSAAVLADDFDFRLLDLLGRSRGVEPVPVSNVRAARATVDRAIALLRDAGLEAAVPRLCAALVPRFDVGAGAEAEATLPLRDAKVDGIPDLRTCLYNEPDASGCYRTLRIWPRCGACHRRMLFLCQIDLLPWLLPVQFLAARVRRYSYGQDYVLGPFGVNQLTKHLSILADKMLHVFLCPEASGHFDCPAPDVQVLISDQYASGLPGDRANLLGSATIAPYLASVPMVRRNSDLSPTITPRRITGLDFRVEIDGEEDFDDLDAERPDGRDASEHLDDLIAAHPDVFHPSHVRKFTVLGAPRSQQTPRRYFGTFGSGGAPARMTPLLSFDDERQDVTYQIYADFAGCDGHVAYGKVDASCT